MSRWKVKKCRDGGCPDWHVYDPHGEFHGPSDWQDALAYADRAARTVEVTLPRAEDVWGLHEGEMNLAAESRGDLWTDVYDSDGNCITLFTPTELEPLAIHLLALARRKEQT